MSKPKILIAAPVRDREYHLPRYLQCLQDVNYPKEQIGFYFLVNDSSDSSLELLQDFKHEVGEEYRSCEIEEWNLGTVKDERKHNVRTKVYAALAKLRNRVLEKFEESDYDYLFSVDSDIYVKPQILARLVAHDKAFVAAMISNLRRKFCPNALLKRGQSWARFKPSKDEPALYEVDVTGAVALMSRAVTGCRYAWHKQGEDIPFCQAVQEAGHRLYLDTALLAVHDMR